MQMWQHNILKKIKCQRLMVGTVCVKEKQGDQKPKKLLDELIIFIKKTSNNDCTISLKEIKKVTSEKVPC